VRSQFHIFPEHQFAQGRLGALTERLAFFRRVNTKAKRTLICCLPRISTLILSPSTTRVMRPWIHTYSRPKVYVTGVTHLGQERQERLRFDIKVPFSERRYRFSCSYSASKISPSFLAFHS